MIHRIIRKTMLNKLVLTTLLMISFPAIAVEKTKEVPPKTIFNNVNIFNGTKDKLIKGCNVIVEHNVIKNACAKTVKSGKADTVINGKGRTLMPGLIDAHVHLNLQLLDNPAGIDGVNLMTWEEVGALAKASADEYLMSGFT
jgi:imidazolonepropionase-like amidohydrolase